MKHLPLTLATAAVIATLIACTFAINRRLEALTPADHSLQFGGVESRLKSVEHYLCAMDRTLDIIENDVYRGPVRSVVMPESCPGDPGQE